MTADDAATEVQRLLSAEQQSRLQMWKKKFREDSTLVFQWVRQKPPGPTINIFDDEQSAESMASDTVQAALVVIKDFWLRVWDRDTSSETEPDSYLSEFAEPRADPQMWPAITGGVLCLAAMKQKHKVAGPDGWLGKEIFALPLKVWNDLAPVFGFFEQLQVFPEVWSHIAQIHVAKDGSARLGDGVTPALRLRPISLMSVWWRVYCAARLKGDTEQQWLSSKLLICRHGGRKNHDASSAFTELAEKFALGWYVGTLDLSKFFDFVTPKGATAALKRHGFPHGLADAIESLWANQKRYLAWHNEVKPRPEHVATSMPQGDSLSPRVLNLLLSTPTRAILTQELETKVVAFLDDRSWASLNLGSFVRVLRRWREHSGHLGFKENVNKSQFTHKDLQKRGVWNECRNCSGMWLTAFAFWEHIWGAGVHTHTHTHKEKQRLTKALTVQVRFMGRQCRRLSGPLWPLVRQVPKLHLGGWLGLQCKSISGSLRLGRAGPGTCTGWDHRV